MTQDNERRMTDEELAAHLDFAAKHAEPMLRGLGMAGATLARTVKDSLLPVLKAAAEGVAALKETCPEAFDEGGKLRPNWQTIVRERTGMALQPPQPAQRIAVRRVRAPKIHVHLATRAVTVHLN